MRSCLLKRKVTFRFSCYLTVVDQFNTLLNKEIKKKRKNNNRKEKKLLVKQNFRKCWSFVYGF